MNRKKIEQQINVLIKNGVQTKHRSMFFIVGNQCRNQIPILHHMLVQAHGNPRQEVLWCYKKELGFSTNRQQKMKKMKSGSIDVDGDDAFSLFVRSTEVSYRYYKDTHKILGNTYSMLVLQDFESLTPNLLARTIETVEGSGIICFMLRSMNALRELHSMIMDVHARYQTESHTKVIGRFNKRFLKSLAECSNCLVLNDELKVLQGFTSKVEALPPKAVDQCLTDSDKKLIALKESLEGQEPLHTIVSCCKTFDQGTALINFIEVIMKANWNRTVALTAARGRGKSAALGLAIASAVAYEYSNIFVTAPSPENLKTLFEFVIKGFDALEYQKTLDYKVIQSTNPDLKKCTIRIDINREHRQTIQYIHPSDASMLGSCEMLVIDEAAAIPLPIVQKLLGGTDNTCRYLTLMSSTINGYEGTGRSLSLKLLKDMRNESKKPNGRELKKLELKESVRYAPGDPIESWLNNLLCLECSTSSNTKTGFPAPDQCELFYVNRDTLFCYNKLSEQFLQTVMSLYVSSHYKNTPDDLQMLSDAPSHHIFCLTPPVRSQQQELPEVLCVVQVCLEGRISKTSAENRARSNKRAAGDLVPWTIAEQFLDYDFPQLCGARIVRIATHPSYQGMGYGKQAMKMLMKYFEGEVTGLDEPEDKEDDEDKEAEDESPPPLLVKLNERRAEKLDYMGVSYGLTPQLFRFWQNAGFVPVYVCQRANDLTGEHSCVMVRALHSSHYESKWQKFYYQDFTRRFVDLLGCQFSTFKPTMAVQILRPKSSLQLQQQNEERVKPTIRELSLTPLDLQRLERYGDDTCSFRLANDLIPLLAKLFFSNRTDFDLMEGQKTILLAVGLQRKTVEKLAKEIDWKENEVLAHLRRIVKKFSAFLNKINTDEIAADMGLPDKDAADKIKLNPIAQDLQDELREAAKEDEARRNAMDEILADPQLKRFAISGDDETWSKALSTTGDKNVVTIKSSNKRAAEDEQQNGNKKPRSNGNKKKKLNKKGGKKN